MKPDIIISIGVAIALTLIFIFLVIKNELKARKREKERSTPEFREDTIKHFESELNETTDQFMKEILKSGIRRLKNGQNPGRVIDWSYKLQKTYHKIDL